MPRKPVDYSNTHFYKIVCKDLNVLPFYIGHSTTLTKRTWSHKHNCKTTSEKDFNLPVYKFIRDNHGWDNWSVVLIEKGSFQNVFEARKRERELIEELKPSLNTHLPLDHNDMKQYKHDWCLKNRERLCQNKKQYYQENKEKILNNCKKHYQTNITERRKMRNVSYVCNCGCSYSYSNKRRHERTQKHQEYLKDQANKEHTEEFLNQIQPDK